MNDKTKITKIDAKSLHKIQYGMYVITTKWENQLNGQIATTLFQVTNSPIKIAICLSKKTYTHELIQKSNVFSAAILEKDTPMKFIGTFGFRCGRECDKFCNVNYATDLTGCPLILDHSLVIMEASVVQQLDVGTHTLFIGILEGAKKIKDGDAMTYEYYHTVVKGKSPENAPTYINPTSM
jgi:ferric-chelate reductase [NAD(P)H]